MYKTPQEIKFKDSFLSFFAESVVVFSLHSPAPLLPERSGLCPGKWCFPLTASLFSDHFKPRNCFFFFFFAVQSRREADHRATPEHKRRKLTSNPPLIAFTVLEKFKKIPLKKSTVKLMT